jgi:hypothetical protein
MTYNSNQKDIMKLTANIFQDKQQSLTDMGNFTGLANLAYNKATEVETNLENLSNLIKKIAEITISNENTLTKFNDKLEDTRNIAIESKNIATSNNLNIFVDQSKNDISGQNISESLTSGQYTKILSELLDAKKIALEAKQIVSEQKKIIDLNLNNLDNKFNTNTDKFNKHINNISFLAENASNIAEKLVKSVKESHIKLNDHIENIPKLTKPKLYGNIDQLLTHSDFNGKMDENHIYMINTNTHLINLNSTLIFKSNTKYNISQIKKITDTNVNYDYTKIKFINYYILDEPNNYITNSGLYIIPKNNDLIEKYLDITINNYINTEPKSSYFLSNKLTHDTYIIVDDTFYFCGPYCNVSNTQIYESEIDDIVLEIIIDEEINDIQLNSANDKYFYIKKADNKYYLVAKVQLKYDMFNNIKLILYLIDTNNIPFPRIFILNMNQSINSLTDIINIDNSLLKSLFFDYYNIVNRSDKIVFNDLYNLIQTILPSNCQIIKLLAKIKQKLDNGNIYLNPDDIQSKTNLLLLSEQIDKLIIKQKNINKNSQIDEYIELIKIIYDLIRVSNSLSPKYIPNTIIQLAESYIDNLNKLFENIKIYLSQTRFDSKQYNLNKFSDFIKIIFPLLAMVKDSQINIITELGSFDGF